MGKLDGKVALITGAGSGIGRATALLFALEGAKVAVVDYVPTGGQETAIKITDAGGKSIFIEADVSKATDAEKMIKTAVATYGRLDILFNNAGIMGGAASNIESTTEEEWDRIVNINLKGVFLGSKYAIPVMRNQGGGAIINTASVAGLFSVPGGPAYAASKAGVIQLTKTLAAAYGRYNIRINCICPGTIQTGMTAGALNPLDDTMKAIPLRRSGQPEEVARTVLYLASNDSSYVTGLALLIDGGWALRLPLSRPGAK